MNMMCIFFGIIFILSGIWLGFFQGYNHIRAWKEMSESEKKKVNIKRLSLNVGEVIALSGIIFILRGLNIFLIQSRFTFAMVLWLIIAGLDVLYISKSKRYVSQEF